MARGLSPNQQAVLSFLGDRRVASPPDPEKVARWGALGMTLPPDLLGHASQHEIRAHLRASLGVDISDGNMSRLCHALRKRQLVTVAPGGQVQLAECVEPAALTFERQHHKETQIPASEVQALMLDATRKALDAEDFGTQRAVLRRDYWSRVKVVLKQVHESREGYSSYFGWRYTSALSELMTSWKKAGLVQAVKVPNPRQWGDRRAYVQAYVFKGTP